MLVLLNKKQESCPQSVDNFVDNLWITLFFMCKTYIWLGNFAFSRNKNHSLIYMKKKFGLSKVLVLILLSFVLITYIYSSIVANCATKFNGVTIVLDAGHGGRDGGSIGVAGTIEKEINLEYVMTLKNKLVKYGYKVELTRKNDDGLYSPLATNKKQSDMNARFKIIKKTNPNLVISIHMNSFQDPKAKGATTYFRKDDIASKTCADLIQRSLNVYCGAKSKNSKVGDYYMLNCSYYTAVLIECGFLSNPEEEKLLNTDEYKNKITDAIFAGILLYFGENKNI